MRLRLMLLVLMLLALPVVLLAVPLVLPLVPLSRASVCSGSSAGDDSSWCKNEDRGRPLPSSSSRLMCATP
jgi:hypothetical protein